METYRAKTLGMYMETNDGDGNIADKKIILLLNFKNTAPGCHISIVRLII